MHVLAQISTMTHLKSNNLWQKWRQQTKKKLCWLKGAKRHLNIFNSQWFNHHWHLFLEWLSTMQWIMRRRTFRPVLEDDLLFKARIMYTKRSIALHDQSPPVSFVVCLLAPFGALYVIMRRFLQTLFKFSLSPMLLWQNSCWEWQQHYQWNDQWTKQISTFIWQSS